MKTSYKLLIEYDGTRYSGWQVQKNARTIQGELLEAAKKVCGPSTELTGSGRTDAGVHAIGQVASLTSPRELSPIQLMHGLNDLLPSNINILRVSKTQNNFNPRADAVGRSYIYQISKRRTAFGKKYVWWIKDSLDSEKMSKIFNVFKGMHDFTAFSDKDKENTSTKVLVEEVKMRELPDLILIRIRASHFLWKMVRRIVGCAVEVGRGTVDMNSILSMLDEKNRSAAEWTAPPSGLFLEQVRYKNESWIETLEPAFFFSRSLISSR